MSATVVNGRIPFEQTIRPGEATRTRAATHARSPRAQYAGINWLAPPMVATVQLVKASKCEPTCRGFAFVIEF